MLIEAALVMIGLFGESQKLSANACDVIAAQTSVCTSGAMTGNGAVLNGTNTTPGVPGAKPGAQPGAKPGKGAKPGAPAPVPPPPLRDGYSVSTPAEPVLPRPVTLADIAGFVPTSGIDHMEPEGWMIVGLPANFYVTGSGYEVAGSLLGQPATVRFAPVSYRWTYGDGTSATRSTTGAPWAAQGLGEFETTATSHVYAARGTYFIDLTVTLTASYQFAGGAWRPIAGTLPLKANRLQAYAGAASTVLVERDCLTGPIGPGCE
ncbi:hypothetical protein BH09ACT1_BH09ACT1_06250 [soil metagenome]